MADLYLARRVERRDSRHATNYLEQISVLSQEL
jgi:hypothetical protein